MEMIIKIEDKTVALILRNEKEIVDQYEFKEEHNLSEVLLVKIDELLKKNKIEPKELEKATLDSNLSDSFTTTRIAASVVNVFNWRIEERSL